MKELPNKKSKRELRKELHLTRPPRLEGAVKEAMMRLDRKPKKLHQETHRSQRVREYTEKQRKDYQLRSKHH